MKGNLFVTNRQRAAPVDLSALRTLARSLLLDLLNQPEFDLGIYLVGSTEMARLNEMFLHHEGPTDVITFNYGPEIQPATGRNHRQNVSSRLALQPLHGEIFICAAAALKHARRFRTRWQSELVRYLIHGVLHLRGFDDQTPRDRRRMKREEDRLLRQVHRGSALLKLNGRSRSARRAARKAPSTRR